MSAVPTSRPRARDRRGSAIAIVIALIALIVVAAAVYWFMSRGPKGPGALIESSLKMAPGTTQAFVAFDVTSKVSEADQKEFMEALKQSKAFKELSEEVQREAGISLEQDVLSWMKPAMAIVAYPMEGKASLFTDADKAKDAPFNGFAVVGVKDEAQAKAAIPKMVEKSKGTKYKTEDYKGATLWVPEKVSEGPTLGLSQGMLIIGIKPEDVKLALDGLASDGKSLINNERYKKTMAQHKYQDAMVAYGDLEGMIKGAPLDEIPPQMAEVKNLVMGLRTFSMAGGWKGKDVASDYALVVDPAVAGKLGAIIFKPEHGIDFKTVELYPEDTEMYGAINLKMVWNIIYDIMGEFPETKMYRDMPAVQLQQQGVDLKADILDPLSGELSYSVTGYGKVFSEEMKALTSGQEPDPNRQMEQIAQMPIVIALGMTDKAKIQALIDKFIPEAMRSAFKTSEHGGFKIWQLSPENPPVYYSMVDDFLLFGLNQAEPQVKAMIDAKKAGKGLKNRKGYSDTLSMLGGKPIFISFVDIQKVYGEAAKEAAQQDPALKKLIEAAGEFESTWSAATLRKDGLYGVSMTLAK